MNELINLGNGQFVKVTMLKGEKGSNIATITKTGTSGLVDTYTVTLTDGSTTTFNVTNGSSIESIEKTGTVGLVDIYTITLTNGETSTFEVTNGNAENLQDAFKASQCAIKAGVSQVTFTNLGDAYITYIPNSECVENAVVVVGFDNGSMYKGTMNYSSALGKWGLSNVELIQGTDVPATWDVGYGNDSVGTRAFRTGTDFVYSNGIGIALSTSDTVTSYYCVLSSGRVSDNYLQTALSGKVSKSGDTITGGVDLISATTESPRLHFISSSGNNYIANVGNGDLRFRGSDGLIAKMSNDSLVINNSANLKYSRSIVGSNSIWKNAELGVTTYFYEGADTTTLDLPYLHCFVVVNKSGATRGVAIAYSWVDSSGYAIWINKLHDSWLGWKRVGREADKIFSEALLVNSSVIPLTNSLFDYSKIRIELLSSADFGSQVLAADTIPVDVFANSGNFYKLSNDSQYILFRHNSSAGISVLCSSNTYGRVYGIY